MSNQVKIGERIRLQLEEKGMKVSHFANMIRRTRQNVHHIFTRDTIDTDLLFEISKCLNHDFFREYSILLKTESEQGVNETIEAYHSSDNEIHVHIHLEDNPLTSDVEDKIADSIKKGIEKARATRK